MNVYIVVNDESRDHNILGVFSTEQKAKLLVKKLGKGTIEEHKINSFDSIDIFKKVSIDLTNGNCGWVHNFYYLTEDNGETFKLAITKKHHHNYSKKVYKKPKSYIKNGRFFTHVYSTYSWEKAIEIANERMIQYKKSNNL